MRPLPRILYIEGSGNLAGGGQISLLELLRHLSRDKFAAKLVCPAQGDLTSAVERLDIKTIILPMRSPRKNPLAFLPGVRKLRRALVEWGADLVHANTSRAALYAGLAAKPLRIPVVWHVRVIEGEGLYDRYLVGLCAQLIAISQAVRQRFQWLLKTDPAKVTVIHNGVDLLAFNPQIRGDDMRRELNLPSCAPVAGIVGNLLAWKGHECFLRAAQEVLAGIPAARFLVVGDGECRAHLERLSQTPELKGKVIFTGRRSDIPRLMAAMDVLVHSSISPEPFARVVIEGMAMGLPVVAMNEGGVPEIIEDGVSGVLIPPKNPALMARTVMDLFANREKARQIGRMARRRTEEYFSIEKNARATEEVYRQALLDSRQLDSSQ